MLEEGRARTTHLLLYKKIMTDFERGITAEGNTTTPLSMSDVETPSPAAETKRPAGLSDGPNARSKAVTTADGPETYGVSFLSF